MEPLTFTTPRGLHVFAKVQGGRLRIDPVPGDETTLLVERVKDPDALHVHLDEVPEGHLLVIEYRGPRFGFFRESDLVLRLRCPERATVEVAAGSTDVEATGTIGGLEYRGGSGDVSFDRVSGDVRVKVGSGDLHGAWVGGSCVMQGASGDVDVRAIGGDLEARTASGDVAVGAVDGDVAITTVSGDVAIRSLWAGRTGIRVVSGDVRVGVAAGADVRLDVTTTSGDATSDLGMVERPSPGGRQLDLKISSVSGDVHIARAPARDAV